MTFSAGTLKYKKSADLAGQAEVTINQMTAASF